MNERIRELALQAGIHFHKGGTLDAGPNGIAKFVLYSDMEKFAELIVKEMCGLMEEAEDDAYHCFEPSERPTEYIDWLRDWQERFTKHFGVEE